MNKKKLKKIFYLIIGEKYYPLAVSLIISFILVLLFLLWIISFSKDFRINDIINNTISIWSILVWLLTASLAIIMQIDWNNQNIKFLKEQNKYDLLLNYFMQAIYFSFFSIICSFTLLFYSSISWLILFFLIFNVSIIILSSYRCVSLIFKIIKK